MKSVELYTDGACSGNPGKGGYGGILMYNGKSKEFSGYDPNTTNNRMELTAVIVGVKMLKEPVELTIYSDSAYVVNAFLEDWVTSWIMKGWRTANKKPVQNVDLWQELDSLIPQHEIRWVWVKGHNGHPENERVDTLARNAIKDLVS